MKAVVVLTTVGEAKTARKLARLLVEKKLAACVTIQPKVVSFYLWKNKLESSDEALMLIKTSTARFKKTAAFIKKHHPYELPEIISLPVQAGSKEYLKWLNDSLR